MKEKLTFTPTADNIIIKRDKGYDEKTFGGIYMAHLDKSLRNRDIYKGLIVAIGPGKYNKKGKFLAVDPLIQVGMRVCYSRFGHASFVINDEEMHVMKEYHLFGEWSQEVSMASIRPLLDRIVVKRLESEEKTKGGIFIPELTKEKPIIGEVIAVGAGKRLDNGERMPIALQKGQHIMFGKHAGVEAKVGDDEFLILKEDDVIGVVDANQE